MSIHAEEYREEGPRPVRFSILGQMQHRNSTTISVSPLRASSPHSYVSTDQGSLRPISPQAYYSRKRAASLSYDDDEGGGEDEDQPLDFSKKLTNVNARNGGKVVIKSENWRSHSSESGVSDVCSTDSPQSDVRHSSSPAHGVSMKSPSPSNGFPHPLAQALSIASNPLAQHLKMSPDSKSEFPLYNSISMEGKSPDITSPTLSAATSQLLNSLAAVTNGGGVNNKGGKNPRPFKAYPRDPMSLPLGLYGMPVSGLNNGELMLNQASNDAYSEFRRQMLAQVQATKTKRARSDSICLNTTKSPVPTSTSDNDSNNSVNGEDYMPSHHEDAMAAMAEANMLSSSSPAPGSVNNPMNSHSTNSETSPVMTKGDSNKKRLGRNEDNKDEAYWERRRKNNEAAKRSRDARRAKEDEIAIRAAFLEQENLKLRFEVAALKSETAKLRCMIYQS